MRDVPLADIDPQIADMVMEDPDSSRLTLDAIYTALFTINPDQAVRSEKMQANPWLNDVLLILHVTALIQ